jgi:hypothetical protein
VERFHGLQGHLIWFLWNFSSGVISKTNIYKTNVRDLDDLKNRISQEILAIKKEILHNVFLKVEKRLNFCISVQGDIFEKYF